jgi:hypothetical protein
VVIAGRSSHFCPRCQRRPRHVARMHGSRMIAPRQERESAHARRRKGRDPILARDRSVSRNQFRSIAARG